jgi:hypothetical protein
MFKPNFRFLKQFARHAVTQQPAVPLNFDLLAGLIELEGVCRSNRGVQQKKQHHHFHEHVREAQKEDGCENLMRSDKSLLESKQELTDKEPLK